VVKVGGGRGFVNGGEGNVLRRWVDFIFFGF